MKQLIVYEKCQEEENGYGGAQKPTGVGRGVVSGRGRGWGWGEAEVLNVREVGE